MQVTLTKEQYDELKKKVSDAKSIISNLQTENKELKKKVSNANNTTNNLQTEVKELKKKVNSNNALKNFYKNKCEAYENSFDELLQKKTKKIIEKKITEINHKHMLEIIALKQQIFNLTAKLNNNYKTSNIPFYKNPIGTNIKKKEIKTTPICNSRKVSNKHIGAQMKHQKHELPEFNENEIDEIIEYNHEKCSYCNSENIQLIDIKKRDEIDIEIKVKKRRHKFYIYKCLDCGKIIQTKIPLELHAKNQYGVNIKTLVMMLTNIGYISVNRTKDLVSSITNNQINMSEGYISSLSKKFVNNTNNFIKETYNKIINGETNFWDDTVAVIGKNRYGCFRTYTNDECTYFTAHDSKSKNGIEDDGILMNLSEDSYLMHDHFKHNYNKKYKFKNLECNAHIARNLEGIYINTNHKWAKEMKNLLESTHEKRNENIQNKIMSFSEEQINEIDEKYDELICLGKSEYEKLNKTTVYKKELNMLKFMEDYKKEITAWIRNYKLPYSNNKAENSFRFIKSKLKISGLFKSLDSIKNYAKIMSYIETCKQYKVNKFDAMKRLIQNNLYTYDELQSLIPANK